ncbi:MAG TPA: BamA/TamA family outer membrane protein [bacterium]
MRQIKILFILSLFVLSIAGASYSQKFGRNKVQYGNKDWEYIQSTHFDIYYYQGARRLAEFAADVAESSYVSLSQLFNYQLTDRIPFILYRSHNDFTETNTSPNLVEESVGGFTEFLKNRIVLPFDGSYEQFRHVIHHELTHAVMLQFLYGSGPGSIIQGVSRSAPPLWFIEGLAEFTSIGWDTDSDMFVRDATLGGYLPPIPYLQAFLAYKGGQAVLRYVEETYGRQKVTELLQRIRTTRNFDRAWRSALNEDLEESNKKWQRYMRKKYWPEIANRKQPFDYAQAITDHTKWQNFVNNSPAVSPSGDRVAFLTDRTGYFDIYVVSATDKKKLEKLVSGQRKSDLEELQWLRPGMSWSNNGKFIVFSSRSAGEDVLNILDVDKKKIIDSHKFDLDGLFAPAWSPTSDEIAFVGVKNGYSDIFVFNLVTKELRKTTDDIFSDTEPTWSPDGTMLAFVSDRKENVEPAGLLGDVKIEDYDYHTTDIYLVKSDGSGLKRLTSNDMDDKSPQWTPDGEHLLFVSDKSGISNIYYIDMETEAVNALTDMITGIAQLSIGFKSNRLAFTAFSNAGYDIYIWADPFSSIEEKEIQPKPTAYVSEREMPQRLAIIDNNQVEADKITSTVKSGQDFSRYVFGSNFRKGIVDEISGMQKEVKLAADDFKEPGGEFKTKDYKIKFGVDYAGVNAGYDPILGVYGLTQLYLSDVLGDHQVMIGANLIRDLNNSDFLLGYANLKNRMNWSATGYQFVNYFLTEVGTVRFLRRGLAANASYPFSRFHRIDLGLQYFNIRQEFISLPFFQPFSYSVLMPSIAYNTDNTIWWYIGPAKGNRNYIGLVGSPKIGDSGKEFVTGNFDFRRYYSLGKGYTFATRFSGGASFGKNPTLFIMGGVENWLNYKFYQDIGFNDISDYFLSEWMMPLRGAELYELVGSRAALFNMEFRFPFIQYLITSFPLKLGFSNIQGSLFFDAGSAWSNDNTWRFTATKSNGSRYVRDIVTAFGYGIRANVYLFLLRFDAAWRTDFDGVSKPLYYWSIGLDF